MVLKLMVPLDMVAAEERKIAARKTAVKKQEAADKKA